MNIIFIAMFVLLSIGQVALSDTTVTIGERPANSGSCEDNWVVTGASSANNNGGSQVGSIGDFLNADMKSIIRFSWTGVIPSGSEVQSASIEFVVHNETASITASLYEFKDANNDWPEGTADGAAQANSSCHNDHTYNSVQEWAGGAGFAVAGTDYTNTVLGTVSMASTGVKTMTLNAAGVAAFNRRIIEGHTDIEFIVVPNDYATNHLSQWRSSEYAANTAQRVQLTLTYRTYSQPIVVVFP